MIQAHGAELAISLYEKYRQLCQQQSLTPLPRDRIQGDIKPLLQHLDFRGRFRRKDLINLVHQFHAKRSRIAPDSIAEYRPREANALADYFAGQASAWLLQKGSSQVPTAEPFPIQVSGFCLQLQVDFPRCQGTSGRCTLHDTQVGVQRILPLDHSTMHLPPLVGICQENVEACNQIAVLPLNSPIVAAVREMEGLAVPMQSTVDDHHHMPMRQSSYPAAIYCGCVSRGHSCPTQHLCTPHYGAVRWICSPYPWGRGCRGGIAVS